MAVVLAPDEAGVATAAAALLRGELVAFPTETVYGLGALALDAAAVARVFEAKGRPASNPVIVHVEGLTEARALSASMPALAERLAEAFWPGPLTIVVPRGSTVPDIVTAGGSTVALRAPSHPVARALLRAVGAPVAAPSANRSTELSPTRAAHVVASLGGRVAYVLDGGPCPHGIESTVVDATGERPVVLRPGSISRAQIARAMGDAQGPSVVAPGAPPHDAGPARSPGQMARHYAPRARVYLVDGSALPGTLAGLLAGGQRVRALGCGTVVPSGITLPRDPVLYAQGLYGALHELDAGADALVIEAPPAGEPWEAVHDRLCRAAARG
jgi:L-threonylcarbamoyladenylate synthase